MSTIKQQLYKLCEEYISERETSIRKSLDELREAVGNETKSSAGDKYETTRETMQQEVDRELARLNELLRLRQTLDRILPDNQNNIAVTGSLVHTNNGNYYIAISAGVLKVGNEQYYAISAASPIGELLQGKVQGSAFSFNGKSFTVLQVQ